MTVLPLEQPEQDLTRPARRQHVIKEPAAVALKERLEVIARTIAGLINGLENGAERTCKRGHSEAGPVLISASLSISAKIAEGNGRLIRDDRRNFGGTARDAVQEGEDDGHPSPLPRAPSAASRLRRRDSRFSSGDKVNSIGNYSRASQVARLGLADEHVHEYGDRNKMPKRAPLLAPDSSRLEAVAHQGLASPEHAAFVERLRAARRKRAARKSR